MTVPFLFPLLMFTSKTSRLISEKFPRKQQTRQTT